MRKPMTKEELVPPKSYLVRGLADAKAVMDKLPGDTDMMDFIGREILRTMSLMCATRNGTRADTQEYTDDFCEMAQAVIPQIEDMLDKQKATLQ